MTEVKEGIVLDREGNKVFDPHEAHSSARPHVRVWQAKGWPVAVVLGIAIPLLFVAGVFVFGVFAIFVAIFLVVSLLRMIFSSKR